MCRCPNEPSPFSRLGCLLLWRGTSGNNKQYGDSNARDIIRIGNKNKGLLPLQLKNFSALEVLTPYVKLFQAPQVKEEGKGGKGQGKEAKPAADLSNGQGTHTKNPADRIKE